MRSVRLRVASEGLRGDQVHPVSNALLAIEANPGAVPTAAEPITNNQRCRES